MPNKEGYGTRVKIIEALMLGSVVVTSQKGIEGIEYNKNFRPPFVAKNDNEIIKFLKIVVSSKKFKIKSMKNKKKFVKIYSMELITRKFFNILKKKVNNDFKT